ncbi:hypothetical protein [Candidatus Marithrix sp. Canyon 246]|nr:hypothetical protein [Candidatus Marithrix sp. Canyon 246]
MLWLDKPQRQLLTLYHSDYPPHAILFIHGDSTVLLLLVAWH